MVDRLCHDHSALTTTTMTTLINQLENSTSEQVILDPLDLSSSGKYRCEVSAEAPSFQTVSDHGEMMVVGEYRGACKIALTN